MSLKNKYSKYINERKKAKALYQVAYEAEMKKIKQKNLINKARQQAQAKQQRNQHLINKAKEQARAGGKFNYYAKKTARGANKIITEVQKQQTQSKPRRKPPNRKRKEEDWFKPTFKTNF